MRPRTARRALLVAGVVVVAFVLALQDIPYLSTILKLGLGAATVVLCLWLAFKAYRAFLWRVGRRLAFSYFLVGVLPIPMVLLLLAAVAYLLAGFFLGHLYRDAARQTRAEVAHRAAAGLREYLRSGRAPATPAAGPEPEIVLGYYRDGRRIGGDPRTPAAWPGWMARPAAGGPRRGSRREESPPFYTRKNGSPTLAAAAGDAGHGVVALYAGDLERALAERSDVWIELFRPDDEQGEAPITIQVGDREIPLQPLRKERTPGEAEKFFKRRTDGERFWDVPLLYWGEVSGKLLDLETGRPVSEYVVTSLNATPRTVQRHFFSSSAEIDAKVWGALLVVGFLLFDVYVVAALMASFMIFGLSRAVNRLSRATAAVQSGDFSVRIPVKRRDQLGAMQRSFNQMAENLESLVATAAQKEAIEKELAIARELQKSLIPTRLPSGEGIEFATLFEPSAAIGGDYFDILRLSERQLAVIIADVSGHGLSTGLRMAMLKAALLILVEEAREPEEILHRLDAVVRSDSQTRFFVTATLALLDLATGRLDLTNAAHPPTYLVRGREVREILLPGAPLGGLGHTYGKRSVELESGDLVVWLSDGLIEAENPAGEPFGYDAVVAALQGGARDATELRNRLLAAVERHAAGTPPSDDRTLVVMQYRHAAAAPRTADRVNLPSGLRGDEVQ